MLLYMVVFGCFVFLGFFLLLAYGNMIDEMFFM